MSDKTQSLKLSEPIEIEGKKVETLNMRRPKVKDALAADLPGKSDLEKEIIQFSNLCEVPPDALEELPLKDYTALQKIYSGFLS